MDIKHVLVVQPPRAGRTGPTRWRRSRPSNRLGWAEHEGGEVEIGHRGDGFGFDNEFPRHHAVLTPFALADRLVTCGEWLEFMDDGGYRRPELWLSDGWAAVNAAALGGAAVLAPRGRRVAGVHPRRGRGRSIESEPVCHVSYYEADAFAHWTGYRLPTETEWEAVATQSRRNGRAPHLHPLAGDRPLSDLAGEVWQWTASAYSPYPGFRAAPGAVGEYNGKFMVNQHVLRGGACVTPEGHTRATYRNFFHPGSRWAFSGLRVARDL